ncbi:MAG: ferritin-like domain-containing protein [Parafilimonas sp.]|nr:ferritin-like domain-containing protein [Parafilimonas sp.]
MNRRTFLTSAGTSALIAPFAFACTKNNGGSNSNGIDLGSGDVGVLNYFFTLAQLQAAFYVQLVKTPYTNATADEISLLTDIRDHAIGYSGFYNTILSITAIGQLKFDFSGIDFSDRESVLNAAKTFEDLIVSAYNGAAKLFSSADYLQVAAKIASVEARHAAYIRDLLSYGSFADATIVDMNGLDVVNDTSSVLNTIAPFLLIKLDASHLPTN